jgi:molecular chaperone GrpE
MPDIDQDKKSPRAAGSGATSEEVNGARQQGDNADDAAELEQSMEIADQITDDAGTVGADNTPPASIPGDGDQSDRTIEELREELAATKDQLLRKAAEFQNYRKRREQEKLADLSIGKTLAIQPFLDVLDDLGRSLEAARQTDPGEEQPPEARLQSLVEGVELVYRKFEEALDRLGVTPIDVVGKPFDEHEHEAMLQQPAPEGTPSGIVLQELQRGYRMGERILRHSRVIVST